VVKNKSFSICITVWLAICCCLPHIACANSTQQRKIDSLQKLLLTVKNDTNKVKILNSLGRAYNAIYEYAKSDSIVDAAISLADTLHYKNGMAIGYFVLAVSCRDRGQYAKGLEYCFKSLAIFEQLNDKQGLSDLYNCFGILYDCEGDFTKALEYHNKALNIRQEIKDKRGISISLNNIACVYGEKGELTKVIEYFTKALDQFTELGDKFGMGTTHNNLGSVYGDMGEYDKSKNEFEMGLKLQIEAGDMIGTASTYNNLGDIALKQNHLQEALAFENKGLALAKQIGALEIQREVEEPLSEIYEKMGDGAKALEHYKAYIAIRDSLLNKENTRKSVQAEMSFEFEKKQATVKAEQDKKDLLEKEQEHKQQLVIYFISGILLLVIAFAFFAYRSYMQKQRANKELDSRNQKLESAYHIIEEKNREITDSINYAQRIQQAILPSIEAIHKVFPESFVLFKPKDIVSGDFYFFAAASANNSSGSVFLAAADCTGHGVPGAFMSMIGSEKLRDAVQQNTNTGQILGVLNKGIKTSLHQSAEHESTRDGMDIALCAITSLGTERGVKVQFSGAYRPMFIIRKGAVEIEEIKATKRAIGGFTEEEKEFIVNELSLNRGDIFYIFSDGYADQFGGADGKKLTTRKFKELLLSLKDKPMAEQQKAMDQYLESWRGNREQLDDVLVIGVRI
jgi:serine phosphatase RsbU (regulator of sigma subunit)